MFDTHEPVSRAMEDERRYGDRAQPGSHVRAPSHLRHRLELARAGAEHHVARIPSLYVRVLVGERVRLQPCFLDQPEPRRARKEPEVVLVEHRSRRLPIFLEHDRERHAGLRFSRWQRVLPHQVRDRAAGLAVALAGRVRLVGLGRVVWNEQGDAAGLQVHRSRRDRAGEIHLGKHVHDRVVDQHRVEVAPQSQRAHVALDVLGLGVQRPALRQHVLRDVGERHTPALLQVAGVVTAAATEFQHGFDRPLRQRLQSLDVARSFFGVVGRRRHQVPPPGQLRVELQPRR